jgi:hypothetical protein
MHRSLGRALLARGRGRARAALWAHRRGFAWADAEAGEHVIDALDAIDNTTSGFAPSWPARPERKARPPLNRGVRGSCAWVRCQGAPKTAPVSGAEKCTIRWRFPPLRRSRVVAEPGWRRDACAPLAESVALALERDHGGVVDEPVDQRGGDHGVAEDLAPLLEAAVRGDDDRAAFVAARDERKQQVGGLALEREPERE